MVSIASSGHTLESVDPIAVCSFVHAFALQVQLNSLGICICHRLRSSRRQRGEGNASPAFQLDRDSSNTFISSRFRLNSGCEKEETEAATSAGDLQI